MEKFSFIDIPGALRGRGAGLAARDRHVENMMNTVTRNLVLGLAVVAFSAVAEESSVGQQSAPQTSQSGYERIAEFGGPDGVSEQLKQADEQRESLFKWGTPGRWLEPWYDWKARIKEENGVALGFFFSFLGQTASDTTDGDDSALGGIYRFNGSWTVLNNGGANPGRIEWRVEARSDIGNNQAPQSLGIAIGMTALNSGFAYSERFKTDISVLNWTQGFRDSTTGIAVGRLAFDPLAGLLEVSGDKPRKALRRRLQQLVASGRLLINRKAEYCLLEKIDAVTGTVSAHPDGFGFLIPDGGSPDVYLPYQEMRSLLNGDRIAVRVGGAMRNGKRSGSVIETLERGRDTIVGQCTRPASPRLCRPVLVC